jgi:hypothetical protein
VGHLLKRLTASDMVKPFLPLVCNWEISVGLLMHVQTWQLACTNREGRRKQERKGEVGGTEEGAIGKSLLVFFIFVQVSSTYNSHRQHAFSTSLEKRNPKRMR